MGMVDNITYHMHRWFRDRNSTTNPVSGAVNGVNKTFTLSETPITGTVRMFVNMEQLPTEDFTVSGLIITSVDAPVTDDDVWVHYQIEVDE